MVSIALIQIAILSSFIYQVFRESKKPIEKERDNVRVATSRTSVSQLEFDETASKAVTSNKAMSELSDAVNEDEISVLSFLLSKGGETYQAEIARELGLPKSTVSRIIRRLHDKGLVTVRRVSKYSYVQITDMDYVSDLISRSRLNNS
ncbi:helix-turn-helix domain-containing protein [Vulcanisaeta souniana]|nr:MarR family transcriptional regulator [Vulcanisaeta souniana]